MGALTRLSPLLARSRAHAARTAPRVRELDSGAALFREGYLFGTRRFTQCRSDVVRLRIAGRRAVLVFGEQAAAEFYAPGRMTRRRALPMPALTLLLDVGSVALLDDAAHRHRKQMFLSLMTPAALEEIGELFEKSWHEVLARRGPGRAVLLDVAHEALLRAVCAWSGVPLRESEVARRVREFAAMVEGAGSIGPRNWRGQLRRRRSERWMRDHVEHVRAHGPGDAAGRPLAVVAAHRELDGSPLDHEVAAVELINVLRPTLAVARYVVFLAHALYTHPETAARVAEEDDYRTWFVQEVRRDYPFFPLVGGRVRQAFDWRGEHFPVGAWVLLDLQATNHDPRTWQDPEAFWPERFRHWNGSAFALVPQGGGDHETGHRCAGEWLTIELMTRAARLLAAHVACLPAQDLSIDLTRMPAKPSSGVVLSTSPRRHGTADVG
jgi:fatty-acid peroxygenase